MFADKLLRKNKKIRQACKVEGKILSTFSLSLYIQKICTYKQPDKFVQGDNEI